MSVNHAVPTQRVSNRWAVYFAERFPIGRHSVVVAAFVFGALAYAGAIERAAFSSPAYVAAFVIAWLFFLELRIADEFKDAADDARYRPYRPVPRGVVTLRELGTLAAIAVLVQIAIAAWAGSAALAWLLVGLGYLALMTREFFVRRWLRSHASAYVASHALIVPLIASTVAACGGRSVPLAPFAAFLGLSYATSIVFELGRKIRAPADEQEGVETYSALWKPRGAVGAWLAVLSISAALALACAYAVGALPAIAIPSLAAVAVGSFAGRRFLASLQPRGGNVFATVSAGWLIVVYVALGVAALVGRSS